jgi:hypothetical protein
MATRSSWSRIRSSLCFLALMLAGCTAAPSRPPLPAPAPAWHEVTLPVAGTGRPEVAAVAACPGHQYAAGAYRTPDGGTTPALWASADGRAWQPVPTRPVSAYGPMHLLFSVACRGDTVVAVGSAAGGAHGNPRTATWVASGTRPLTEVPNPFELYGGPNAIGVGRLTAGPAGWLLSGARLNANGQPGAAVWAASDGRTFQLVDADPELESDARGQTSGVDVLAGPDGFTLVGSVFPLNGQHAARAPLAWTSRDGVHWHRVAVPAPGEDAELQRAVPDGDGLLVLGVRGAGFGVWHASADGGDPAGWHALTRFGDFHGTGLPGVTGLATLAGTAYAVVADGERYQLWAARDRAEWGQVVLPVQPTVGEGHQVALAGAADALLLAVEDGAATRLWTSGGS